VTRCLVLCLLLAAIAGTPVRAGLDEAPPPPVAADASPDPAQPCTHVSFSRRLQYGDSEQNVLDVATGDAGAGNPRPVLLFVAGESFAGDGAAAANATAQDAAMCFAARNGMVGVKMAWRPAPAFPWPAGAKDVAAAASWVHENIDLFGGNAQEVVAIGYAVGAFHVASLLGHPELADRDTGIAGAVLVSGIYRESLDADGAEKSYFGNDASKYDERSAFPGILHIETPLVVAWSTRDPPRLVTQGEQLKDLLCKSRTRCPHIKVLTSGDDLAAIFAPDAPDAGLAQPTLELVREIEARGLP
jgi:acetyl esterase/lipase